MAIRKQNCDCFSKGVLFCTLNLHHQGLKKYKKGDFFDQMKKIIDLEVFIFFK